MSLSTSSTRARVRGNAASRIRVRAFRPEAVPKKRGRTFSRAVRTRPCCSCSQSFFSFRTVCRSPGSRSPCRALRWAAMSARRASAASAPRSTWEDCGSGSSMYAA